MIGTLEFVEVLDQTDKVSSMIIHSEIMAEYTEAERNLRHDKEAQRLIRNFNRLKDDYEDLQRFGRYHPDYNKIMERVRSTKRKMDLNNSVATFKRAERNLQQFLDEISEYIAHSVSKKIIVPRSGANITDSACGTTGCGAGGTCNCQVS